MPKNLEATVDIIAPPERVWAVVADPKRIPEFSPQCVRMQPLGALKPGTWTVNLNRDGWKYWPTTSRIVAFEPNREFAFKVTENRSTWRFTLEPTATGTRLTQTRDMSDGTTAFSRNAIKAVLGGEESFEVKLEEGMKHTLAGIKAAVETLA
ncbi:SRPBCC family protein [Nocardia sp. NPDC057353]|uniref:SRPBCC family protein n=1 Tax=Nocardia sp. NPDC057353 TaxID=3346104 RepID=UPI00362F623F